MNQTLKRFTLVSSIPVLAITLVAVVASVQANAIGTTVNSSIGSIISVFTSSGTVAINATPSAGGVQTINNDVVTVSTNNTAGYTLQINESTAATALVSGGNSIPAISGTIAAPVALTANTWGFRVDSSTIGGFGATTTSPVSNAAIGAIKFAAIPTTAATIKTTAATATNDTTNVWYGVAVDTSTPTGTYSNSVVYTAVTN